MNAALAAEIGRLTPAEKLQLVEELWAQLSASEHNVPISQAHRDELDRRLADAVHEDGRPWGEVRDELLRR